MSAHSSSVHNEDDEVITLAPAPVPSVSGKAPTVTRKKQQSTTVVPAKRKAAGNGGNKAVTT